MPNIKLKSNPTFNSKTKSKFWVRYPLQVLNYAVFMLMVWYFSSVATFEHIAADQAVVALTLSHAGAPLKPCRRLTQDELAQLSPNMRKPFECGRKRSPILIEAYMDGEPLFITKTEPPGLYGDGGIDIYHDARVPVGQHNFMVRMNDSVHETGFNYQHEQQVELQPAQLLIIDFDPEQGFTLK